MKDHPEQPASGRSHSISHKLSHNLHLACRECQRKKIKCDRTYPCGPCSRGGLSCVPSTRKPRAKTGTKAADAELRQRIAKLEKLVESFQGEDGKDESQLETSDGSPPAVGVHALTQPQPQPDVTHLDRSSSSPSSGTPAAEASLSSRRSTNKFVAGTFWSSLTSEVKALADAFEEDEDGSGEEDATPGTTPESAPYALDGSATATQGYELIFCPPGVLYVMPGALQEPDPVMSKQIFESYLFHVEPIHKIFHVPTLRAFFEDGHSYLGRSADAPCNKALRAAIHFAGINSFTEDECQQTYGKSLDQLAQEFRRGVDIALYQADPLNTTELATLQALTLYVASVRVLDPSRRAWSMTGLIARIARAMSVHRELPGETPFMAELRRRLWYAIIFLDCYSSIDRGTEPAIHPDSYTRIMSSNANDADFDENSTSIPNRENEVTDMSMALIAQEGSVLTLRLAIPEDSVGSFPWQRRLELAYEYQKQVHERYLRHCNPKDLRHVMIAGTGAAAAHSIMLRAVRPLQFHTAPPPVDSPWVMQLALNILRHANHLWETMYGRWRRMPWVPWHAMAVALAGLCSIRGTEQANEAWDLVDRAMQRYASRVADSRNGMLWKPIEKLYKRAAAFRDGESRQVPAPPPASAPQQSVAQQADMQWTGSAVSQPVIPVVDPAGNMILDGVTVNEVPESSIFDFPPETQATLPNDNSWLDWEAVMRDMDELKADDMQWI